MQISTWLERAIVGCLFLIAIFAPHSIAVTQAAWLLGVALWLARLAIYPRPSLFRSPVDYALIGFFVLSGISSIFSYSPITSIGKMRAASLFTIVYLVSLNVRSLRLVRLLALALIGSCMINVLLTAGQLAIGRGVKVQGVTPASPLTKAVFRTRTVTQPTPVIDGDTVWQIDGQPVETPEELATALASGSSTARIRIYRVEWMPELEVPRGQLLPGNNVLDQLGIGSWSRGRDWRATGFFNHWVTYSEVLQLIASLALGIFLGLKQRRSLTGLLLVVAVAGLAFALGMTVTRASWIGFAVSVAAMLLLTSSRRTILIAVACAIPLVLASVILLQQKRSIGFFDRRDQSTSWREMVWKEGFQLLVSNPRHLVVGIGQDSIKAHWREWGLFDNGRLPIGHMHSNLLQIALERGVPALIVWLILIGVYIRMLWRITRREAIDDISRGVALGALGGVVGFFTSGLVHYNWGDSEVVTVVYLIMGLCLVVERTNQQAADSSIRG
ncbi:MAG TPA: O-antigen ligase family protein [Pyrinomonadaceae bacterium]|jgi:O-antigen ligase|nr:O-antigen ligase family protein [Pyrinomonadaceae bacterium]